MREAFEKAFLKPLCLIWRNETEQYDPYDPDDKRAEASAEDYHRMWVVWKACEAQAPVVAELKAENERLRTVLSKINNFLDANEDTSIGHGSAFHYALREALKESKS